MCMYVMADVKDLVGKTISYFEFDGVGTDGLVVITKDAGVLVACVRQETDEYDNYNGNIYLDPWDEKMIMDNLNGIYASMFFAKLFFKHDVITALEFECFIKEAEFNQEKDLQRRADENRRKDYEMYLKLKEKFEPKNT